MQNSSTSLPNPDNLTLEQLADKIIGAFLAVMQNYSPVLASDLRISSHNDQPILVQPSAVYSKFSKLQVSKVSGPDDISPWLLIEYAAVLAHSISSIIYCSFKDEMVPADWKKANVVPIPKSKPVKDLSKDLRPISLTPVISKVAEEFEKELKPTIWNNKSLFIVLFDWRLLSRHYSCRCGTENSDNPGALVVHDDIIVAGLGTETSTDSRKGAWNQIQSGENIAEGYSS